MSTFQMTWSALAWIVFAFMVAGFAIKQMSYVIVNGSIFEWVRNGLKRGMRDGVFGAETAHALFTCTLCMTTQLSIWLVGIPMMLLAFFGTDTSLIPSGDWRLICAVAFGTLVAFGVGGLATVFMTQTEYPPQRYQELLLEHQKLRAEFEKLRFQSTTSGGGTPSKTFDVSKLGFEIFSLIFDVIHRKCQGYDCRYARANCLENAALTVIKSWLTDGRLNAEEHRLVAGLMPPLIERYNWSGWGFEADPEDRSKFIRNLYDDLIHELSVHGQGKV